MDKVTFDVKGMSCGHCKGAVEKALKGLDGVSGAEVSLDDANVTVTYNKDKVSEKEMKETVKEAGYQV